MFHRFISRIIIKKNKIEKKSLRGHNFVPCAGINFPPKQINLTIGGLAPVMISLVVPNLTWSWRLSKANFGSLQFRNTHRSVFCFSYESPINPVNKIGFLTLKNVKVIVTSRELSFPSSDNCKTPILWVPLLFLASNYGFFLFLSDCSFHFYVYTLSQKYIYFVDNPYPIFP
jgi:hypothetical protein